MGKVAGNNSKVALVGNNTYTKFDEILSSAPVIHFLESIISKLASGEVSFI